MATQFTPSGRRSLYFSVGLVFLLLTATGFNTYAQVRAVPSITLSGGYEAPLGTLGSVFKRAPAVNLELSDEWGSWIADVGGYAVFFSPKPNNTGANWAVLNELGVYVGTAYALHPWRWLRLSGGADIGTAQAYERYSFAGSTVAPTLSPALYLASKLGLDVRLSGHLGLALALKYDLFSGPDGEPGHSAFNAAYVGELGLRCGLY